MTAPDSLSNQESGASTITTIKGAKEPQKFSGNALEFKEWVFAMDLVMRSLAIDDAPYFAVKRHPCASGPPYLCFAAGTVPNQLGTNFSPKSQPNLERGLEVLTKRSKPMNSTRVLLLNQTD